MQPNLADPIGLRDRAILEVFYSTGMRRMELIHLKLFDLDLERGTILIRQGKGKKDRFVPIGERAAAWVQKYIREARPKLAVEPDDGTLFLASTGEEISRDHLTAMVRALRGPRQDRQDRIVPSVPPHDGDADARRRSGHPLHPANARPRGTVHHGDLHARLHPHAQAGAQRHASGSGARQGTSATRPRSD